MFYEQELGSYAQGQGSLAVFKVTARDQGHYKGPLGAFVTYCNISCFALLLNGGQLFKERNSLLLMSAPLLNGYIVYIGQGRKYMFTIVKRSCNDIQPLTSTHAF